MMKMKRTKLEDLLQGAHFCCDWKSEPLEPGCV